MNPLDLTLPVHQETFGELVGISQPAVSDLMKRGVIAEGGPVGEWLLAYTKHLRDAASGRGDGELANERARLAREQANAQAMKNAQARRELAPVGVIEEVLAHVGRQVATVLEGLLPKLRRQFPELTADQLKVIATELAKARQLAASVNLSALDANEDDDQD